MKENESKNKSSSLQKVINMFKEIDFYSITPNFKVKRQDNFKTLFGSFLSIFTIFFTLISLLYFYVLLIDDKNPRLLFSIKNLSNPPLTKFDKNNYGFGFSLQDPFTYDQFIDETIYHPLVFQMTGTRVSVGNATVFEWSVVPVELDECSINKFPKEYHTIMKDLPFKDYYCMKDPTFDLAGTFLNSQYKYLMIKLFECKNATDSIGENRRVNRNNLKRILKQEENGDDYFDFSEKEIKNQNYFGN